MTLLPLALLAGCLGAAPAPSVADVEAIRKDLVAAQRDADSLARQERYAEAAKKLRAAAAAAARQATDPEAADQLKSQISAAREAAGELEAWARLAARPKSRSAFKALMKARLVPKVCREAALSDGDLPAWMRRLVAVDPAAKAFFARRVKVTLLIKDAPTSAGERLESDLKALGLAVTPEGGDTLSLEGQPCVPGKGGIAGNVIYLCQAQARATWSNASGTILLGPIELNVNGSSLVSAADAADRAPREVARRVPRELVLAWLEKHP